MNFSFWEILIIPFVTALLSALVQIVLPTVSARVSRISKISDRLAERRFNFSMRLIEFSLLLRSTHNTGKVDDKGNATNTPIFLKDIAQYEKFREMYHVVFGEASLYLDKERMKYIYFIQDYMYSFFTILETVKNNSEESERFGIAIFPDLSKFSVELEKIGRDELRPRRLVSKIAKFDKKHHKYKKETTRKLFDNTALAVYKKENLRQG